MRTLVGALGVALPVLLLLGDGFIFHGTQPARGSLSAYYFSGMRDLFVGLLFAIAVFLVCYKAFERSLDNTLTIVAGLAAIGVALFSTHRPGKMDIPLTPLQHRLGEPTVTTVHYVSAGIFIVCLAVISLFFGIREGKRPQQRDGHRAKMSPAFWRRFHIACASFIGLALVFIGVSEFLHWFTGYSLIIGESAAVFAFGASWLAKGLELDVLTSPRGAARVVREEATVDAR
jgi:predicted tellurium resistance membrane protein TerC